MNIIEGGLDRPEVLRLLREHLEDMNDITPPGSVHALDLDGLLADDVTFWSAWDADELVGVGALKRLGPRAGELKSMRTAKTHEGRGVASALLAHITEVAVRRDYTSLSLETGALPAFARARAFYERHGFRYVAPFADYVDDPNSVFMTRSIGVQR